VSCELKLESDGSVHAFYEILSDIFDNYLYTIFLMKSIMSGENRMSNLYLFAFCHFSKEKGYDRYLIIQIVHYHNFLEFSIDYGKAY